MQNDEILTQEQAAEMLGYSIHTLEDMRAKKKGPVFSRPENGKIFYLKSDLFEWVKNGRKDLTE